MTTRVIVNIRGANASGKTTLMRRVIGSAPYVDLGQFPDAQGKMGFVQGHQFSLEGFELPFLVIGRYDASKYSGCDKIKSADQIEGVLRWAIDGGFAGHVLFEGFRVSKSWARFAAVRNWCVSNHHASWVWAFLRAEPELIFERSAARREADARPIDKEELAAVCRVMASTWRKAKVAMPRDCLDLDASQPTEVLYAQLLGRIKMLESA